MTTLLRAIRHRPRRAAFVLAISTVLVGLSGVGLYGLAAQPNPSVRMLPMNWQKTPAVVLNTGVDAQGMTLDQWTASGKDPRDWQPIPAPSVVVGMTYFTLRYQEFRNKLAEPTIQRTLLCGKLNAGAPPTVDISGLTPFDLGTIPAPTRTDGAAVKNHPLRIPDYVMKDASGAWLTRPRTCLYKASAKFIKNPVQVVEIAFEPVPMTIVAPAAKP